MEIKIYREPENIGLVLNEEETKEYNSLVSLLNIATNREITNQVPNVYLPINNSQIRCLEALCPMKVDLKAYNRSSIPLEILKVIKFAEDNKMFDFIRVWYDDTYTDPMIIGYNFKSQSDREKNYTFSTNLTLIARWGDCAYELVELLKMGRERIVTKALLEAKILKQNVDSFLQDPELHIDNYIAIGKQYPFKGLGF